VLLDGLDGPVGKRHDAFTVTLGQREYVGATEVLDLPPDPDRLFPKIEIFKSNAEQFPFPHSAGNRQLRQSAQ
jgi:hypothetical protein